jgi:hypothetical protein
LTILSPFLLNKTFITNKRSQKQTKKRKSKRKGKLLPMNKLMGDITRKRGKPAYFRNIKSYMHFTFNSTRCGPISGILCVNTILRQRIEVVPFFLRKQIPSLLISFPSYPSLSAYYLPFLFLCPACANTNSRALKDRSFALLHILGKMLVCCFYFSSNLLHCELVRSTMESQA